jgi:hypothetical protein
MTRMTAEAGVRDVLLGAAELLDRPGAWTQGWSARTATGDLVFAASHSAVCWCVSGAICRVGENEIVRQAALDKLRQTIGWGFVSNWNDTRGRTQAEVVAALRQAASSPQVQS